MRGIFTLRRHELLWFYQEGASYIFPDAWGTYSLTLTRSLGTQAPDTHTSTHSRYTL